EAGTKCAKVSNLSSRSWANSGGVLESSIPASPVEAASEEHRNVRRLRVASGELPIILSTMSIRDPPWDSWTSTIQRSRLTYHGGFRLSRAICGALHQKCTGGPPTLGS